MWPLSKVYVNSRHPRIKLVIHRTIAPNGEPQLFTKNTFSPLSSVFTCYVRFCNADIENVKTKSTRTYSRTSNDLIHFWSSTLVTFTPSGVKEQRQLRNIHWNHGNNISMLKWTIFNSVALLTFNSWPKTSVSSLQNHWHFIRGF